jgi:hypothetical protein
MNKDVLSGLILLVLAGAYHWATRLIPDSSLADEVGAQGLPRILTLLLAGLAVLIIGRGLMTGRTEPLAAAADQEETRAGVPRAFGLLAIAAGYVLVAPILGFGPALALLIVAVALYEGMRPSWRVAAVAAGGAIGFWLLFVQFLGVEQPRSLLF